MLHRNGSNYSRANIHQTTSQDYKDSGKQYFEITSVAFTIQIIADKFCNAIQRESFWQTIYFIKELLWKTVDPTTLYSSFIYYITTVDHCYSYHNIQSIVLYLISPLSNHALTIFTKHCWHVWGWNKKLFQNKKVFQCFKNTVHVITCLARLFWQTKS